MIKIANTSCKKCYTTHFVRPNRLMSIWYIPISLYDSFKRKKVLEEIMKLDTQIKGCLYANNRSN